jgi:DNA-binding transcriptional regulator/RsmH inhibitor MraZ
MARTGLLGPELDQVSKRREEAKPPRGFYPATVDKAGRVKLPAKVKDHVASLTDKRLFVTLNEGMAKIYTNGSWDRNLEILQSTTTATEEAERVATLADVYGEDVLMDSNGRVTLPQELRRKVGLEDQPVQLRFFDDVLKVYTLQQYERVVAAAEQSADSDVRTLKGLGFK